MNTVLDGKEDWRRGNYQRSVMPFKEERERVMQMLKLEGTRGINHTFFVMFSVQKLQKWIAK